MHPSFQAARHIQNHPIFEPFALPTASPLTLWHKLVQGDVVNMSGTFLPCFKVVESIFNVTLHFLQHGLFS